MDTPTLIGLYRDMWLIRAFEQGLEREFEKGNVPGMLHTGLGQEATQAALAHHLKASDTFFPDHRCHGINALAQHRYVYACVNNGYAISMPVGEGHASADIVDMVKGYGIPTRQLDGNHVIEAAEGVGEAVDHIRSGKGPYFLEFKTWRWQGIFAGEFRPEAEVKYWREDHDPIMLATEALAERDVSQLELDTVEQEVKELIEEWISFAMESPSPDPAKATADVYVGWEVATR